MKTILQIHEACPCRLSFNAYNCLIKQMRVVKTGRVFNVLGIAKEGYQNTKVWTNITSFIESRTADCKTVLSKRDWEIKNFFFQQ